MEINTEFEEVVSWKLIECYSRCNIDRISICLQSKYVRFVGIQIERVLTSKGAYYEIKEFIGNNPSSIKFSWKDIDVDNMTKEDIEFIRIINSCNNPFLYDILPMLKDLVDGKEQWNNVSEKIEEIYAKYR